MWWDGINRVPSGERKRILVVDDNEDHLLITKSRLEQENSTFDVEVVHSGEECLRLLEDNEFECIISDYQMKPGMDGLELLQEIRNRHINVAVIVITDYGDLGVESEAYNKGADDYFNKSVGFAHFPRMVDSIRRAISKRQREQIKAPDQAFAGEMAEPAKAGFTLAADGITLIGVSEAAACALGQEWSTLEGAPVATLISSQDRTRFRKLVLGIVKDEEPSEVIRFLGADGATKPFRVTGIARQECGSITGLQLRIEPLA